MKKTMVLVLGASLLGCGIASADLAVSWKNTSKAVLDPSATSNAGPYVQGAKVQLIWSTAGITTEENKDYDVLGGMVLAGEIVLAETVTSSYGFWTAVEDVFVNSDVGGVNVNSGKFFTRIFEDAAASNGSYFYDINQVDAAGFVYNPQDTATVYTQNTLAANINIADRGTKVIPEPGTIGLMGVAGLGLFLARKKSQR